MSSRRSGPSRRHPYRRRRAAAAAAIAALALLAFFLLRSQFAETDTHGATVVRYSIHSRLAHATLAQVGVVPAGRADGARPLLVFLHGKGQDHESNLTGEMLAALSALGRAAPDVVFPYGGEDSYWHDRRNGAWGSYVIDEVIPEALRRLHADPHRVAIGGLSMGGFGAYDLARLHPGAFCAIGGDSAALWRTGGETAAGAFDDGEDFSRHDIIGGRRRVGESLSRGDAVARRRQLRSLQERRYRVGR